MSDTQYRPLTDFDNDVCNLGKLQRAIKDDGTLPSCTSCGFSGDGVNLVFVSALTGAQSTTLDAIVSTVDTTASITPTFIAPSKLVNSPIALTAGWTDLGGVRTSIGFFLTDAAQAVGQIGGDIKTVGTGAKLRIVKSESNNPISAEFDIPATADAWQGFGFQTNAPPDLASQVYKLQGDLGTATSAEIRFVSMSLIQIG